MRRNIHNSNTNTNINKTEINRPEIKLEDISNNNNNINNSSINSSDDDQPKKRNIHNIDIELNLIKKKELEREKKFGSNENL